MSILRFVPMLGIAAVVLAGLTYVRGAQNAPADAVSLPKSAIDEFVAYQNGQAQTLLKMTAANDEGAGLTISAEACVVTIESYIKVDLAHARAQLAAKYGELARALKEDANSMNQTPAEPERQAEPANASILITETVQRFDLSKLDLTDINIRENKRGGVFVGIAKVLSPVGLSNTTNVRLTESMAEIAETPLDAEKIRKLGSSGLMCFQLPMGDERSSDWTDTRETFLKLREKMLGADDATNIVVMSGYHDRGDGERSIATGQIEQPKAYSFVAASAEDLKEQTSLLRKWKSENCN